MKPTMERMADLLAVSSSIIQSLRSGIMENVGPVDGFTVAVLTVVANVNASPGYFYKDVII